jgi:filamentous hemagglutinin family protein
MLLKVQNLLPKFFIFTLLLVSATPAKAQITPDGTLGAERSVITPNTPIQSKNINADLITGGAQRGRNLFHSFGEFNVGEGKRVYFANPSDVTNILTRVTGGNRSNILGTLGVDGAANLFLINPNGIVFGSGAALDLRGSFVGTTANGVQFGNQGLFSATNPQAPPLLTIDPSGLLFNQLNQGAAITNKSIADAGVDLTNSRVTGLRVPDGKSLLLVGGDVVLDGGRLTANSGRVELAGLAAPGTIGLNVTRDTLSLSVPSNVQRGNVSLKNQANVDVSGAGGGDIAVNAAKLDMSNSGLFAGIGTGLGNGSTKGGNVNVNADSVSLSNGAQIGAFTQGKGDAGNIFITARDTISVDSGFIANFVLNNAVGNAGNIEVQAGNILLENRGAIASTAETEGNSGNIDIKTGSLTATNGAQINSSILGRGRAGNITIQAKDTVTFDGVATNRNHSGLFSYVLAGAVGNGGNINISAGSLSLTNGGQLGASVREKTDTLAGGQGNGGTIDVNVRDALTISGLDSSGIFANLGTDAKGRAGNINIQAGNVLVKDGGQINSFTRGTGNAGNITIIARDAVTFDGVFNKNNSGLASSVEAGAVGNGGDINITAGSLNLTNGGEINTTVSSAFGNLAANQGIGGTVNINVRDALTISGTDSQGIFANLGTDAKGRAGNINIQAGNVLVKDGGQINSFTRGTGNAGNITIIARDAVTFDGRDSNRLPSALFSNVNPGAVGNGGNINITAGSLSLTNGGQLEASVRGKTDDTDVPGQGNGGTIDVNVRDALTISGTDSRGIFANLGSDAKGRAGNINIQAGNVLVKDGGQINSFTRGRGNAGNITITAKNAVTFKGDSGLSSNVLAGGVGNGGNINITAGSLALTDGGQINVNVQGASNNLAGGQGNGGSVNITVGDALTISGSDSGIFGSVSTGAVGSGGDINIQARSLSLSDNATVTTSNGGQGNAGNILIKVIDSIFANNSLIVSNIGTTKRQPAFGNVGNIEISARTISFADGAQLQAGFYSRGQGKAGLVSVKARDSVSFAGTNSTGEPSAIFTDVEAGAVGNGSDIQISAPSISFSDGAQLIASNAGQGNGGNISITTDQLSLTNGARFSASTLGQGNAGNITIVARDAVTLDGEDSNGNPSALFSNVPDNGQGLGNSGTIDITARSFTLTNGAQLGVSVRKGQGSAGNITINANSARLNSGLIFAETDSSSNGGNITLNLSDYLLLRNGSLISTSVGTANAGGNGGNITITTPFIVALPNENSDITANAFSGNGGKIDIINAELFGIQRRAKESPQTNDITASSQFGRQGQINIAQPEIELVSGLLELPIQISDAANKFSQLCPNSPNAKPLGEFVITGKGNIPPNPLQLLPGRNPDIPLATAEDMQEIKTIQAQEHKKKEEQEHSSKVARKKNKDNTLPSIVEAQGIVQTPDGQIYFVANANHATPSSQPTASVCPSQN